MRHDLKLPALLYLVISETLLAIRWGLLRWTETVLVSHNKRPLYKRLQGPFAAGKFSRLQRVRGSASPPKTDLELLVSRRSANDPNRTFCIFSVVYIPQAPYGPPTGSVVYCRAIEF